MTTYVVSGELGIFDKAGKMIAQCADMEGAKLICAALNKYKPKGLPKGKSKCRWPGPVYVASYADGHEVRMSFWSDARYPIDLVAAKEQAAKHRPVKTAPCPHFPFGQPTGEFTPLVSFHVEYEGRIVEGA